MYFNFEGEHAPKKRNFWSKFSKKCPKTAAQICMQLKIFGQSRVFIVFWECSQNQFVRQFFFENQQGVEFLRGGGGGGGSAPTPKFAGEWICLS